jgi:hypothetical protein
MTVGGFARLDGKIERTRFGAFVSNNSVNAFAPVIEGFNADAGPVPLGPVNLIETGISTAKSFPTVIVRLAGSIAVIGPSMVNTVCAKVVEPDHMLTTNTTTTHIREQTGNIQRLLIPLARN